MEKNKIKEEKTKKFGPAMKKMSNLLQAGKIKFITINISESPKEEI